MVYTCTNVGWPTVQLGSEYTRPAGAGHTDPGVIHASSNCQPLAPPGCQVGDAHRLNNYKDTKCRLYWCLIEFIDWRYSQSCWYFRPDL
jgi:hypothetical protein